MTRNRCTKGWTVFVIVVLMLQMPAGVALAAAAQEPSPPISGRSLGNLVPQSDARVERIVGKQAWALLEERAIARHRGAWEAALKTKEARGWKKTEKNVQSQAFDIGGALLIEWEWHCDPYSVCATYYFESYYDGGSILYDAEFVPTGDRSGYSPWANLIATNPGRDTRRQRAAIDPDLPGFRLTGTALVQRAPDDANCPGDLWEWNQCMRDCIARRHEGAMIGTAGSVGASLTACARAVRPNSMLVMGLSYLGCVTVSVGAGALSSFSAAHYWSPCDSGGQCGPKPC
jgi:hypothetical protein